MAIAYFDTSALVKLLIEEDGADIAGTIWDSCDQAIASRLAYPETCAALAAAHRLGRTNDVRAAGARRELELLWADVRPVEVSQSVARRAGELARTHALRAFDAVHLASAVILGPADTVFVGWDLRLQQAALAEGLRVAPVLTSSGASRSRRSASQAWSSNRTA